MRCLVHSRLMKTTTRLYVSLVFLCLIAAAPKILAVSPPPDGGYPGGNTAEGQNALFSLTTGGEKKARRFLFFPNGPNGGVSTRFFGGGPFSPLPKPKKYRLSRGRF